MKIAFISDAAFPWHIGGLEAVELTEAKELAKENDVHFFCMKWPGMEREFTKDGIHYHPMVSIQRETFYRHGRRSIRSALFFTLSTLRIFKYRFDVVEVNLFPFIHLPIIKLWCKLTGCKMILDVVEVWSKEYWTEYLGSVIGTIAFYYTNYFCNSPNAYIVNSTATEEKLIANGIDKHRIFRFAPVLDDELIRKVRGEKPKKQRRIIFWGRFIKEKRIDKWIDVVEEAHHRLGSIKGLLIGGGSEDDTIRYLVKSAKLQKVINVRPNIGNDEVLFKEVMKSALLLHMSEREGMSLVTLESLALGVPVVLPSYSPIPKEIKGMCVVVPEEKLPETIVEIIKSKNKEKFIRNKENLAQFSISRTGEFYKRIFKALHVD
jgi:L-malate glycosyltransferase